MVRKKTTIVQVPVDAGFLGRIDETAGVVSESRAEFVREAVRQRLDRIAEEERERRYVEGYRRRPEDGKWARVSAKALSAALPDEEW